MIRTHSPLASCIVFAACAIAAGQDCNSNGVPDTQEAFRIEPGFASQYVPMDDNPTGVALGDFDGDGDLDAAVGFMANCCTYPGGTRILLNDGGTGHMVPANLLNAGVGAHDVVAADFDGDGNLDIATVDWIPHTVSIQLNSGGATFAPAITIPIDERPIALAVADMNRDGKPDLAVIHQFLPAISVLLNQGSGVFIVAGSYPLPNESPEAIAAADLDGDGAAELVVAEAIKNVVSVWKNSGSGQFTQSAAVPAGENLHRVVLADLNGDGRPDLAASQETACCPSYGQVLVAINNGDGTFGSPATYWTGIASYGLAAGDLDRDGDLDLVVSDLHNQAWWLLNRGNGTFVLRGPTPLAGEAVNLASADLDGDGDADVMVVLPGSDRVAALINRQESVSNDCNGNGQLDICDIAAGVSADCNQNDIPDECDIQGFSADCNGNGVPDECDLRSGTSQDCNYNRVPDECDLANGTEQDCNHNNRPDSCDPDYNENGIPDECEPMAGVLLVKADAYQGDETGLDWENAVMDLQRALDMANASDGTVKQIWVAKGTYRPWRRIHENDARTATFSLLNDVALRGGFAGTEASLAERDLAAGNITILDGDLMANDEPTFASRADNVYHVVTGSDLSSPSILDGFVIRGGNTSTPWDAAIHNSGGGLYIDQDPDQGPNALVVANCTFRDNWAAAGGGATYLRDTAAKFVNCRFIANQTGGPGGAVSIDHGTPVLMGCLFSGNHTNADGGAVYSYDAMSTLINCTVVGNTASMKHGGTYFVDGGASVYNSILWGNSDGDPGTDTEQAQVGFNYCDNYVDHSCVMGWTGRLAGGGSFGTDPLLTDLTGPDGIPATGDEDLHVRAGSPCIDAGDNARVLADVGDLDHNGEIGGPTPFDLDGKARFIDDPSKPDTGAGDPPVVDMGVYEARSVCVAARMLPAGYAPGVKLTAAIEVKPGAGVAVYAAEDTPPAGWDVGAINEGGVFDTATGKVKWGPFMDRSGRILTYEVTPPGTTSGNQCFGPGVVSVDGVSTEICGASCVLPCFDHPADVNGDRRLVIDEVTAYASCWKQGCTWPVPPNPIPIGYMTRAGAIWKQGETYCCDANRPPPLLWVNCPLPPPGGDSLQSLLASNAAPSAVRGVQADDGGYLITIDVQPGSAAAYALEETTPAGWPVSSVDEGGLFDPTAGRVRWGPFFDGTGRRLSYRVLPASAGSPSVIAGVLSVDGLDQAISGPAVIALGPDLDLDGDVDRADLDGFMKCVTGPAVRLSSPECAKADFDGDGDVDQSDFGIYQRCFSGTGKPADPNCVK